jgi:hypothetical protein
MLFKLVLLLNFWLPLKVTVLHRALYKNNLIKLYKTWNSAKNILDLLLVLIKS